MPEILAVAMPHSFSYAGASSDFSPTRLSQPPRITELKRKYKDQIVRGAFDNWYAWYGSAIHQYIEDGLRAYGNDEFLIEETLKHTEDPAEFGRPDLTDPIKFSATVDAYHIPTKTLYDHKTLNIRGAGNEVKPEYEIQININAYMLRKAGYEVDKAYLQVFYGGWSVGASRYDKNYPSRPVQLHEVTLLPPEEQEKLYRKLLTEQLKYFKVEEEKLLECTKEQMWEQKAKIAVWPRKAPTTRRAMRLLETFDEVESYVSWKGLKPKDVYIEFRKATRTRCEDYCEVNKFCSQYKEYEQMCNENKFCTPDMYNYVKERGYDFLPDNYFG